MKQCLYYYISLFFVLLPIIKIQAQIEFSEDYSHRIANDGKYLWIASNEGVVYYEKATGKNRSISFDWGEVKKPKIVALAKDKIGNLWIGTEEDELFKYDGISTTQYHARANAGAILPLLRCYTFTFDSEDNLFAGGYWLYWNINKNETKSIPPSHMSYYQGTFIIMDMAFDSKDNLWVAADYTLASLFCHRKSDNKQINIYGEKYPDGATYALAIDTQDNIWLTCHDGIHYYNQATKIDTHYTDNPDIPKAKYTACKIDNKGNVWFTASNYLLKYDGSKFISYTCEGFDKARSLLCDDDVIWIYTANDDVLRFENEKFDRVHITSGGTGLAKTESDVPAFAVTSEDGVIRISGHTGISGIDVYDMTARLILSTKYTGEEKEVVIKPYNQLSKGTYLFKVSHAGGQVTLKAIVREIVL